MRRTKACSRGWAERMDRKDQPCGVRLDRRAKRWTAWLARFPLGGTGKGDQNQREAYLARIPTHARKRNVLGRPRLSASRMQPTGLLLSRPRRLVGLCGLCRSREDGEAGLHARLDRSRPVGLALLSARPRSPHSRHCGRRVASLTRRSLAKRFVGRVRARHDLECSSRTADFVQAESGLECPATRPGSVPLGTTIWRRSCCHSRFW